MTALLSSEELALRIKNSIDDNQTFDPLHYEALFQPKTDHGTAHVNVWGPNGDVVSATSTLNTWYAQYGRGMACIVNTMVPGFFIL